MHSEKEPEMLEHERKFCVNFGKEKRKNLRALSVLAKAIFHDCVNCMQTFSKISVAFQESCLNFMFVREARLKIVSVFKAFFFSASFFEW